MLKSEYYCSKFKNTFKLYFTKNLRKDKNINGTRKVT